MRSAVIIVQREYYPRWQRKRVGAGFVRGDRSGVEELVWARLLTVYVLSAGRGVRINELPADVCPTNRLAVENDNGCRLETEHVVINLAHQHLDRRWGRLHVGRARNMTCHDGRARRLREG